jgi:MFS family permease
VLSIKNGIAGTIALNLSANFFPLFAIEVLDANNYQVGLISSLPAFIGIFTTLIAAVLINRLNEKKRFTMYSTIITRVFIALMIFVPYINTKYSSWVFVILIAVMNLPGTFFTLSWQAFIGDLIPDDRRNSFFGKRNKQLTFVAMIVTLIAGVVMKEQSSSNALPYQILFIIAFAFGIIETYYLSKHVEIKANDSLIEKVSLFSKRLFRHKPYFTFLICGLFFNFSWQMAWSLFNIYQIRFAHADAFWISIFIVANQLTQVFSYPIWSRLADRWGNAKMIVWATFGMALAPVLTILSVNLYYLVAINFVTGFFLAGTVLLLFNRLLEVSEDDYRTSYITNYNFLLSFIAFLAPQFGVFLLEFFNMNVAMITATILRILSAVLFGFVAYGMGRKVLKKYNIQKIS